MMPYELIGRAVVYAVEWLLAISIAVFTVVVFWIAWTRGWLWVSNRMYKGYEINPKEERPPLWKMRIAAVTAGLHHFEFRKIPAAYREVEDLADDDTTLLQHVKETLTRPA